VVAERCCCFCKQAFTPKNSKALFCSTRHRVAYFRLKRKVQQDQARGHYKLSFLEITKCHENRYLKKFTVFYEKEVLLQLLNCYISDHVTKCYSWRFS
jgi:hypothetical protein